ncbi:MAG: hypothetical protein QM645_08435 [Asticcacaulis sp.]
MFSRNDSLTARFVISPGAAFADHPEPDGDLHSDTGSGPTKAHP